MRLVLGALLIGLAGSVGAAELERLQLSFRDGVLELGLQARVAVPRERLEGSLEDYRNLAILLPLVKESRVMAGTEPPRVWSRLEGCLWFLCKRLVHVMQVQVGPDGLHYGQTLPALSDFRAGWARWRVEALDADSRLVLQARLTPRLRVPPVIGPWYVERRLRGELEAAIANLEPALGLVDEGAR